MHTHFVYEYKCRAKSKSHIDELQKIVGQKMHIKSISKDMLFNENLLNFRSNLKQNELAEIIKSIDPSDVMINSLKQIIHYREKKF